MEKQFFQKGIEKKKDEYLIVRNSCGAGCIYLTLVNVSTGKIDMKIFQDYGRTEITTIEINGGNYLSIPLSKKRKCRYYNEIYFRYIR